MGRSRQWIPSRADLPGVALAGLIGAVALGIASALPPSPFVSDILIAMLLGALVLNSPLHDLIGLARPTAEREPDRYAAGLRFTGKWILRAGIIAMGLKVQTSFFGAVELLLIAGVAAAALPSAFFVSHALAASLGVRRPMGDLLAGGTMICGASAVNAIAPLAGARREEQGIAIAVIFLFSVFALVAFRPLAAWIGLDPSFAGIWSGLAVNDLSSAIAVGSQMGGAGGVMAAAAKSARVLLLAPTLIAFSLVRRDAGPSSVKKSMVGELPAFVLGYVGLALIRAAGDRAFGASAAWAGVLSADRFLVDLLMVAVSASIGLHLAIRSLVAAGGPAMAVGGGASLWMASLTLAMITLASRGAHASATALAVIAVLASYVGYRVCTGPEAEARLLYRRLATGAPLSLDDASRLLTAAERDGPPEDAILRRTLTQLEPAIGELIPVRESPLPHGEGCRWVTYWEGRSGWALVAICREPGSATPIHAHPHRLIGKAIEGQLEELRFEECRGAEAPETVTLVLASRKVLDHGELVETDGLATLHLVRVVGPRSAIDLQLRGPEVGSPGRRLRTIEPLDITSLVVGARLATIEEIDDQGHGGEGAAAGRAPAPAA